MKMGIEQQTIIYAGGFFVGCDEDPRSEDIHSTLF